MRNAAWGADVHYSVEHVAPQSSKAVGWREELFDDPQTVNRLGNLILLPTVANSSAGKRPWAEKLMIYRLLSSETSQQSQAVQTECEKLGFDFPMGEGTVLGQASYMPMCRSVTVVRLRPFPATGRAFSPPTGQGSMTLRRPLPGVTVGSPL